jgi:hypothetical protein
VFVLLKIKLELLYINNQLLFCSTLVPPSKDFSYKGESRGLVVKGKDSQLSGCGFESQCHILDGVSEASYYIEKGNKGSQMGHTKKNKK